MSSDKTLKELYESALEHNVDIFSSMVVPADTCIYTNLVKEAILKNGGDLYPIWNDYSILKYQIETWSRSNTFIFEHVDKIVKAQYSPIENTDKYVEHTETTTGDDLMTRNLTTDFDGSDTNSGTDTDTRTLNTTHRDTKGTTTTSTNSGTDTTTTGNTKENTVSGFNSGTYQPESKTTDSGSESTVHGHKITEAETGADTITETGTVTDNHAKGTVLTKDDTTTETGTVRNEKSETVTVVDHSHGKIWVSTYKQLISEEIDLVKLFNAYDLIAEVFINDMCIGVWNND